MNGKAARAIRRDLRRSVGEEAIGVIDAQTNAINHQILPNQNAMQARVENIDKRLGALFAVNASEWPAFDKRIQADADHINALVKTSTEEWRKLNERCDINFGASEVNDKHVKDVYRALVAHRDMGFWQRLRWLVMGR